MILSHQVMLSKTNPVNATTAASITDVGKKYTVPLPHQVKPAGKPYTGMPPVRISVKPRTTDIWIFIHSLPKFLLDAGLPVIHNKAFNFSFTCFNPCTQLGAAQGRAGAGKFHRLFPAQVPNKIGVD